MFWLGFPGQDGKDNMVEVSQRERGYILAGNYELLNAVIVDANRQILLAEKRYDEMLERKNAEIAKLSKPNAKVEFQEGSEAE